MNGTKKINRRPFKIGFVRLSLLVAIILVISSWGFIFQVEQANIFELFSEKNISHTKQFIGEMLGQNSEKPAFLDSNSWKQALKLTFETLQMSIMAIGFATIGMLFTVIPAARTTADGTVTQVKKWYRWLVFGFIRFIYIFTRAVPELIWAMMIIFIFKPGNLPGALALALHNFGILGKLCAEVVDDLDVRPIRSLISSGASKFQILLYGILPMVMPKFITYIMYRWEVIIRTTIVVGFVGAGGLGQQFKLSMSWFHYTEVSLYLICYIILVIIVDFISESLRKAMQ